MANNIFLSNKYGNISYHYNKTLGHIMEIENFIHKKKEIFSSLLEYIDNTENADIESLINVFEKHEILKDAEEVKSTLQLLSKIADNHHRSPGFIDKIGEIIQYLIQTKDSSLSDSDLFNTFIKNKRILLLLLEKGFVQPDSTILSNIMNEKDKNNFPYRHYLYSGIKTFITQSDKELIEDEIKKKYNEEINDFVEKCRIGENDSYICSLIRQDSVEEFISYVNKNNISLSSQIPPSIFETNLFLIENKPELKKYAIFFGAIKITRFFRYSNVSFEDSSEDSSDYFFKYSTSYYPSLNSLWFYAIHSNEPEIIHFLEDCDCKLNKNLYKNVLDEAIKCYHNDIADYLKNNYQEQTKNTIELYFEKLADNDQETVFAKKVVECNNYYYYPNDINELFSDIEKNDGAFLLTNINFLPTKITIPSSTTTIGISAFRDCDFIQQFIIPSSVTTIACFAFIGCAGIKQITIPPSVTFIGYRAFGYCVSLTEITIPSSVTKMENEVFNACRSLKKVKFSDPSNVKAIGEYLFCDCSSLEQITIPPSVNSIKNGAFFNCSSLKQIVIPSTITKIGEWVFKGCKSLKQISIPSSVTKIGGYAFKECSSLTQISISSSVTSIKEETFSGCSSLTQISIPSSVKSIKISAFSGCSSLIEISVPSSSPKLIKLFNDYFPYAYINKI